MIVPGSRPNLRHWHLSNQSLQPSCTYCTYPIDLGTCRPNPKSSQSSLTCFLLVTGETYICLLTPSLTCRAARRDPFKLEQTLLGRRRQHTSGYSDRAFGSPHSSHLYCQQAINSSNCLHGPHPAAYQVHTKATR